MFPALFLFKHPDLEGELARADARLIVVARYAAAFSLDQFSKPLFVTRIESSRSEVASFYGLAARPSVHEMRPCRGLDARTRGYYSDEEIRRLTAALNWAFQYDQAGRLHVALHETPEIQRRLGRVNPSPENEHLHLQVPPWRGGPTPIVRLWWPASS